MATKDTKNTKTMKDDNEKIDTSNKGRVLFLLNYLMEHTDGEHELTTSELGLIYQEHGFGGYRKTIKNDAQALIDAGFNVQINSAKGHADSYCYIEKNDFDAAEIKMLLDAVAAARFLSDDKCNLLIKKLKTLTCTTCADVMTLEGRPSRIHKEGNSLFQVVDVLEYAISKKLRVSFQYYDYDMNLKKVLHNDGEVYTFSPYSFKWEQDRYYILGMVDKRPGIINPFRVDLICNIKLIDAEIVPPPADFVPADYSNKVFKMYGGTKADVIMEADSKLIKKFIDRFGDDFQSKPISDTRFRAKVTVEASPTFYSWVFQYNGGINIIEPANIRDEYVSMLRRVTRYALGIEEPQEE